MFYLPWKTLITNLMQTVEERERRHKQKGQAIAQIETLEARTLLSAGSLDPDFGTGGRVTTDFAETFDFGRAVALQEDGRIVVVGNTTSGGGSSNFALARYNPDGILDETFSFNGLVATDFSGFSDTARAVAIQSDGKILVAGSAVVNGQFFALARYHTDGTLDDTFRNSGLVTTEFVGQNAEVMGLAIQDDGGIVAVGTARISTTGEANFALARYHADGTLDGSFGSGGLVTVDFAGNNDVANAVALQSDGKIVVAGMANLAGFGTDDFALARFLPDGTPDASFNDDGLLTTDFEGQSDFAEAVAIQADGRIVAAGAANTVSGGRDFALARYNSDGTLDRNFDADGRVTTHFQQSTDHAFAIDIQSDGKIVAAGFAIRNALNEFALARYLPDGSLDQNFDADGRVTTDLGGTSDGALGMAIQPDGKIVAAGFTIADDNDFALVRYLGDPIADSDPTVVEAVTINDGADQRSLVTSLLVGFSTEVALGTDAFLLVDDDGNLVALNISASLVDGKTVAEITFVGPEITNGSLTDGTYTLVINSLAIVDPFGRSVDANGDGEPGGNQEVTFHRLFGDSDGDGDVDGIDQELFDNAFRSVFGDLNFLDFFDADGDGDIDQHDRKEFRRRLQR